MEHGVSSDLGNLRTTPYLPFAVMPQKSVSRKAEEKAGPDDAKLPGARIRSRNPPARTDDVRITGKKLETRLDLTLWIIESLVGNP